MQEQFKPFVHPVNLFNNEDLVAASSKLSLLMQGRRSVRTFSDKPIPAEVIHNLVRIAASAPSGGAGAPGAEKNSAGGILDKMQAKTGKAGVGGGTAGAKAGPTGKPGKISPDLKAKIDKLNDAQKKSLAGML